MRRCLILYGITCSLGQILALRELAVAFQGNELVFGAALAIWLFMVAVACAAFGLATRGRGASVQTFASSLAAGGALVPATILAVRVGRYWLAGSSGIAPSFGQVLLLSALALAPLCVSLGLFYATACNIAMGTSGMPGVAAARIYLYEAIGSCVAGTAFTLVLSRVIPTFSLALILGGVNAFAAFSLWWHGDRRRWRWGWVYVLLSGGFFALLASPLGTVFDFASQALRFPGRILRASMDTPYGRVEAVRNRDTIELYENGVLAGSTGTREAAEEAVLPALLAHPGPRRVLLVGGAVTGAFRQALALPWLRVDCIEPDPGLIEYAIAYGLLDGADLRSERGRLIRNEDARRHVRSSVEEYDVIVLCLPNPTTGLLNRFFTREFFLDCRRALRRGGVLGLQIEGAPDYMSGPHRAMAAQVQRTLRAAFPTVAALPSGGSIHFLATREPATLFPDGAAMRARLRAWNLDPKWLTADEIGEMTHPARVSRLVRALRGVRIRTLNTDLRPLAYLHALRLWAEAFEVRGQGLLHRAIVLSLPEVILLVTATATVIAVGVLLARDPLPVAVLAARAGAGAAGFLLELVLLFALQSFYGHLYSHIGILFAAFMGGLAVGAATGAKVGSDDAVALLMLLETVLALLAGALVPLLNVFSGAGAKVAPVVIPAMNFLVGALVGAQYPVGVAACSYVRRADGFASGLYAMDMIGACLGALLGGAIIVPVLGLDGTCWVAAALCLCALPLLFMAVRPGAPLSSAPAPGLRQPA